MSRYHEALARTTLLLNQELFGDEADEAAIADALLATTVAITADERSLSNRAGQTAVVTAFNLTARLGIGIELRLPNVPVIDLRAPLRQRHLCDALIELGQDLIPGATIRAHSEPVDQTFFFGEAHIGQVSGVRVLASDFEAVLTRDAQGSACEGNFPFGGFAAGAAVAAIALEAVVPRIEEVTGLSARAPRPSPGPPVKIDLLDLFPGLSGGTPGDLGAIDVISAGAITHALTYCLLRIPGLRTRLRVIEDQDADLSNVNRYALLRASDDGRHKISQLEETATEEIGIEGVTTLFTKLSRDELLPLADCVVVGVDDVEARWHVQEESPAWLAIGATGNHLAQLTVHVPNGPCAACAHVSPVPPGDIPTISFVSFWAGLLQACALLARSSEHRNVFVYPFALSSSSGIASFEPTPNPNCPIKCAASQAVRLDTEPGLEAA